MSFFNIIILTFMENIVVESHNGFAPVFYIIVAVLVVIFVSIGFLIKKKNFNKSQLIKIFSKSLIITIVINFLFSLLVYFTSSIQCKPCAINAICNCPSKLDMVFSELVYTIPIIFIITLLIVLIFKKRNNIPIA